MNDLAIYEMPASERTPEQSEALLMHEQFLMHQGMVLGGFAGMCQDLKIIRDRGLYKPLGFDKLGDYTEKQHGIKERQAYNYIRVAETYGIEFLHSNAKIAEIGVTKLLEIAALPSDDRETLFETTAPEELAEMSTSEVKSLVEELFAAKKQLGMFEDEIEALRAENSKPAAVEQKPLDEIEADIRREVEDGIREEARAEAERELEELRADYEEKLANASSFAALPDFDEESLRVQLTDELGDSIRAELAAVNKAELAKLKEKAEAAKRAEAEQKEKAQKERERREQLEVDLLNIKKAAEKASKELADIEKLKAQLEAATARERAAQEAKAAAEKQIQLSANPMLAKFRFLFEVTIQPALSEMKELMAHMDTETRAKCSAALKKVWEGAAV